jgi:hypothetical protein
VTGSKSSICRFATWKPASASSRSSKPARSCQLSRSRAERGNRLLLVIVHIKDRIQLCNLHQIMNTLG